MMQVSTPAVIPLIRIEGLYERKGYHAGGYVTGGEVADVENQAAADSADATHLARTFNQMFGIPPSVMMRGEFFEIKPPFELTGDES